MTLHKQKAENIRIDKMCQLASDCLLDFQYFYLFEACARVIDDIQPIMVDVEVEDLRLWTCSVLATVIRYQNLESHESLLPLSLDKVSSFFAIDAEQVRLQTQRICSFLEGEVKSTDAYRVIRFDYLREDMENIPTDSEWLTDTDFYKFDGNLKEDHGPYVESILTQNLAHRDTVDSGRVARIHHCKVKEERLHLVVEGYHFDRIYADSILEHLGFSWVEGDEEEKETNLFKPSSHYRNFMEHHEVLNLDDLEADSLEDLNQILQDRVLGKTVGELREENPMTLEAAAQIEALDAFLLPKEVSLVEVASILKEFPNCVEAHICLAGWQSEAAGRIHHLKSAIEAAETILNVDEIEGRGTWWKDHHTRPYLRALYFLGIEYVAEGQFSEGEDILLDLLDMNPDDNLGVRYFVLEYGVVQKKWPLVRHVFKAFPDEDSIVFIYVKFMYLYLTLGRKSKTKRALLTAFDRNTYPFKILVGTVHQPEAPDTYRIGSAEEAIMVLPLLTLFLEQNPKCVAWSLQTLHDHKRVLEEDDDESWPFNGNRYN